ncbi:MAG: hypothetical protein ACRDQB_18320 [Thermocrispum sp.]
MPTWLAALIALAAIAATYLLCVRPMQRGGHCGLGGGCQSDPEREREIADLREELRVLRAQDTLSSDPG